TPKAYNIASMRRLAAAAALLLLISCGSSNAYAQRRRASSPPPTHEWARGAVFYEVFVRSFFDSGTDGQGDFPGLTSKLDYISSPTSAKRNWYVWNPTNPGWTQPWGPNPTWYQKPPTTGEWYYGVFWSGMPDLNYRDQEVKAEMFRISREWLRKGVDGYRLDAT